MDFVGFRLTPDMIDGGLFVEEGESGSQDELKLCDFNEVLILFNDSFIYDRIHRGNTHFLCFS